MSTHIGLPPWIYGSRQQGATGTQLDNERIWVYEYERTVTTEQGGLYTFYKGCLYPERFVCETGAMVNLNVVKALTMTLLGTFPIRGLESLLVNYNKTCNRLMGPWYLRPDLNGTAIKEIKMFAFNFLRAWGITSGTAMGTARIVAHLFEFDIAFRYPLQDLCTETFFGDLYTNPKKVLKKLGEIYVQRSKVISDKNSAGAKVQKMIALAGYLLYLPKVRRCFNFALQAIDFTKIQFDVMDRYHCMWLGDYDYFGLTLQQRLTNLSLLHGGKLPPRIQL